MSKKGGSAKFGDPILGNILKGMQADATRTAKTQQAPREVMTRTDLQELLGAAVQVRMAEGLREWANRMRYDARQRAVTQGDEFTGGQPYPRDLPTMGTSSTLHPERNPFFRGR